MTILPAILAQNEAEFRRKVERVRPLGLTLHIDVMDGVFVDNATWAPPERMREILGDLAFEAHLMVSDPMAVIPAWIDAGAERVFFHAEAADPDAVCRKAGARCAKLGVALNPETSAENTLRRASRIKAVMVMGVHPGWGGQQFQRAAVEKVRQLKQIRRGLAISVDGGINPKNAAELAAAGADALVAGNALTDQKDPKAALALFLASFSPR